MATAMTMRRSMDTEMMLLRAQLTMDTETMLRAQLTTAMVTAARMTALPSQ